MSEDNADKPKNKYEFPAIIALLVILGIVLFAMGRLSKKTPQPTPQPNISQYIKTQDCLKVIAKSRLDTIRAQRVVVDSLTKKRSSNNKKTKSDVDKIKVFTPTSRLTWRDSVRTANNLR